VLREIEQDAPGSHVLIVAHDVVVTIVRYVLQDLSEEQLMRDAAADPIGNASLSTWVRDDGVWRPERFNDVSHVDADPQARPTAEEATA
jgi:probable phosphoglycerate mutase